MSVRPHSRHQDMRAGKLGKKFWGTPVILKNKEQTPSAGVSGPQAWDRAAAPSPRGTPARGPVRPQAENASAEVDTGVLGKGN